MKQSRVLTLSLGLLLALGFSARVLGGPVFDLDATATGGPGATVDVKFNLKLAAGDTAPVQVQGLQMIVEWDPTKLQGVGLTSGPALTTPPNVAQVVVRRTEPGFAVLGVVMDNDGLPTGSPEVITLTPGVSQLVATLKVKVLTCPTAADVVAINFVDNKYATVDGGPFLENIVVVGGLSLGKTEGVWSDTTNTGGAVTITPLSPKLTIVDTTITAPPTKSDESFGCPTVIPVSVKMEGVCEKTVQGFVTAITHAPVGSAPALKLQGIGLGAGVVSPDFQQAEIFSATGDIGGTLGVIMDFNEPFNIPEPLSTGEIAVYNYCLVTPISCAPKGTTPPTYEYNLSFADNVLGDPLKENLIVIGGLGLNPQLVNGKLTINTKQCEEIIIVPSAITFAAGACVLGAQPADYDVPTPAPIVLTRGTQTSPTRFGVGLWYRSPPTPVNGDDTEGPQSEDHIQGVSVALKFNQKCITCEGTYDLTGTITDALPAEFVQVLCENSAADGDNGELILGILVDALPPFDGKDLPPTNEFLKLVCVDFHVNWAEWTCEECQNTSLHLPKAFVPDTKYGTDDGVDVIGPDGKETPLIRNLASVRKRVLDTATGQYITQQQSVKAAVLDGVVMVREEAMFIRGDCNWSDGVWQDPAKQGGVDISDAAAGVSYLFYTDTWQWKPPCLDACDANDDGRVDLADTVFVLKYLFKYGVQPPAPFPNLGPDPTKDKLGCKAVPSCDGVVDPGYTPDP